MRMSTRGRYGLRVMMELAAQYGRGPISVDEIAKNQEITSNYIHVIMTSLRAAGLARTVRGPKGGYELAQKPASITALDVVSALEGRSAPVDCVLDQTVCHRSAKCAACDVWCEVAAAMDAVLAGFTLEQLATKQKAKQEDPFDYHI